MKIVKESIAFLNEDLNQARALLKRMNISEETPMFRKLKKLLTDTNKLGYIGTFTKWLFQDRESWERLHEVFKMLLSYKGKVPPINSFNKLEDLFDFINHGEISTKTSQMINSLPSIARKKLTDAMINGDSDALKIQKTLELNTKYDKELKHFFSTKGGVLSKIGIKEFYTYVKNFVENLSGPFNLEATKEKIKEEGLDVEIVLERPDLIVMIPLDYKACKSLGSQSFCIARSESTFNSYTSGEKEQYLIYDFTKSPADNHSLIGITVGREGKWTEAKFKDDVEAPSREYLEKLLED
jgi:hypothetical protein